MDILKISMLLALFIFRILMPILKRSIIVYIVFFGPFLLNKEKQKKTPDKDVE